MFCHYKTGLKAFKIKDNELIFAKAIKIAVEIIAAAKVDKEIVYDTSQLIVPKDNVLGLRSLKIFQKKQFSS